MTARVVLKLGDQFRNIRGGSAIDPDIPPTVSYQLRFNIVQFLDVSSPHNRLRRRSYVVEFTAQQPEFGVVWKYQNVSQQVLTEVGSGTRRAARKDAEFDAVVFISAGVAHFSTLWNVEKAAAYLQQLVNPNRGIFDFDYTPRVWAVDYPVTNCVVIRYLLPRAEFEPDLDKLAVWQADTVIELLDTGYQGDSVVKDV
jgi:hypothetical protein